MTRILILNKTRIAVTDVTVRYVVPRVQLPLLFIQNFTTMFTKFEQGVANLRKLGANEYNGLTITNVNLATTPNGGRCVRITTDTPITTYWRDDDGDWTRQEKNFFNTLEDAVIALFDEMEEFALILAYVKNHPLTLMALLYKAKIDVIQQEITAHSTYVGVLDDKECTLDLDHDVIHTYITKIEFSDGGKMAIDKIVDKILS